jgi:hypothetical protein
MPSAGPRDQNPWPIQTNPRRLPEDTEASRTMRFDRARQDRRYTQEEHYGRADIGAAIGAVVRALGRPRRVLPGGLKPLDVVRAWDPELAAWFATLPQNADAWEPLAAEVRAARRAANTKARKLADEAERTAQAQADATGRPVRVEVPRKATELLRLGMSDEVYAYVAGMRWRGKARLAAASELPPVPDLDDEDEDGGGPAAPSIVDLQADRDEEGVAP